MKMDILPIELENHLLMSDVKQIKDQGIKVKQKGFTITAYPWDHIQENTVNSMNNSAEMEEIIEDHYFSGVCHE